jgi:hypothetical protein
VKSLSRALAVVLVVGMAALPALAQSSGRPRRGNQPATQPAQPPAPTAPGAQPGTPGADPAEAAEPSLGTLVTPGRTREWTLTARVNIRAYQDPGIDRPDNSPRPDTMPTIDRFEFNTMTLVWPVISESASSRLVLPTGGDEEPVLEEFTFTVDDRDATGLAEFQHEILTSQAGGNPYHSGVWLALLKLGRGINAREVEFEFKIPTESWETRFDERAAARVPWPEGEWPAEAKAALLPMAFVETGPDGRAFDLRPVRDLLTQWTDGKDPRTIPPLTFAKWIAGQVVQHVQLSGSGLNANRNGLLEGVGLQQPRDTALTGRGSEFDMVVLLAAVYRMAGLPARIVIGYDTEADSRDEPGFLAPGSGGSGDLCAWVEFCLFDEASDTFNWVPVDVVRIRKEGSRLRDNFMEPGALRYFGAHSDLDDVIPFAFQFHPPTTVRAYGSPGFWGWFVTPTAPGRAWQSISIRATTTPRRGGGGR